MHCIVDLTIHRQAPDAVDDSVLLKLRVQLATRHGPRDATRQQVLLTTAISSAAIDLNGIPESQAHVIHETLSQLPVVVRQALATAERPALRFFLQSSQPPQPATE